MEDADRSVPKDWLQSQNNPGRPLQVDVVLGTLNDR